MVTPLEVFLQGRDGTRTAFRSLTGSLDKIRRSSDNLLAKWRDFTVVATGVTRVASQMSRAFTGTIDAAERQVNSEIKLAAALRGTEGEIGDSVRQIKEFASTRQDLTTFGDEVTLELAAIGAEFGLTVDQIERAVVAVQDRALALGRGPLELMRVVGRFGGGIADSLIDVGVVVDKTADRATEFNRAMAEMTSGMSELVGSLPTSALTKLRNTLGDLAEGIGKVVTSTGTFQVAIKAVEDLVGKLNAALDNRETLKEVTEFIDGFAIGILNTFNTLAGGILGAIASIIDAVALLIETGQDWGLIETAADAAIEVARLNEAIAEVDKASASADGALAALGMQLDDAEKKFKRLDGATEITGDAFREMARDLDDWTRKTTEAIDSAELWIDAQENIFDALNETNKEYREQRDELSKLAEEARRAEALDTLFEGFAEDLGPALARTGAMVKETADGALADVREMVEENKVLQDEALLEAEARVEEFRAIGSTFGFAFQDSIIESLDREVGLEQAMANLGDRMRVSLIDTLSGAAFDPLLESFGQLAQAVAQPFNLVGRIINDSIVAPVVKAISGAITSIVGELVGIAAAQGLISSTAAAGVAVVGAQAATVASGWGAAAVAASIATLGAALAFGPVAMAAIGTGAATTAALAAPAALAEGAVVMPKAGGTLVRVAEAGMPELVIPLGGPGPISVPIIGDAGGQQIIQGTAQINPIEPLASFPHLEHGAIVLPQPGGVPVILAEAGRPELVLPLDSASQAPIGGAQTSISVSLEGANIQGDPEEVAFALGDEFAFQVRTLSPSRSSGALI